MSSIDQLLSRALLLKHPDVPADVVPHEDTVCPEAARFTDRTWSVTRRDATGDAAATSLNTLCDAVVTQTAAFALDEFVTEQLPAPHSARVLGCVLQLAAVEEGARFWWQYAAGAGDDIASYCLYLYHLSLGETHAATWWRRQTAIDTQPAPQSPCLPGVGGPADILGTDADASTPTMLRILGRLLRISAGRSRTEVVTAVMDYVPPVVAAGYAVHPDVEIPLPGPDFADQIALIIAVASTVDSSAPSPRARPRPRTIAAREAADVPRMGTPLARRQRRAGGRPPAADAAAESPVLAEAVRHAEGLARFTR
ncbi:hypothetical protein [Actinacidiphila sp. ITFR-21]|uniref:hypothetical protein n=1 Tax=Actinacidiphila sp. ITFR-21 TaxID=3075199 RepID=UPI00288BB50B|nr:hypothetical protein [Streptomyces sp. ITFR-21]WNI14100.1 hypothetical protein RLT57_00205 [Streptomyces sp. ITFR-21]